MAFLLIEIFILAIIGRVTHWVLYIDEPISIFYPELHNAHIPIYLWLSWRIFTRAMRTVPRRRRTVFTVAYVYKLLFTFIMSYLLVHAYSFGDFKLYYVLPYWLSDRLLTFDMDAIRNIDLITNNLFPKFSFNPASIIAVTFTGVFLVLPPSLYGLALLSGTVIFLACLKIYTVIEPHIEKKQIFFAVYFFAPSICLQLGYTGKETLIFPLLAGLFVLMERQKSLAGRAALIAGIFYVRFYQAFFVIVAWVASRITLRQLFSIRGLPVLVAGSVAGVLIYAKALDVLGSYGFDSIFDLADFMSATYDKGNLVLEPWPFPLTYLQIFRPFPWEAHSAMALIVAVEGFALFVLAAWLAWTRNRTLRQRLKLDPFFRFLAAYVLIQILVFSYNDNMGDLVRRKIYFMPLLIGLLCYRRMSPEEVALGRLHGLKGGPVGGPNGGATHDAASGPAYESVNPPPAPAAPSGSAPPSPAG